MLHEKVYKMIKNNNYRYFLCLNKSSSLIMSAYFITWKQAESGHVKCKHKDTKFPFSCVHVHVSKCCVKAEHKQLSHGNNCSRLLLSQEREHVTCTAFTTSLHACVGVTVHATSQEFLVFVLALALILALLSKITLH